MNHSMQNIIMRPLLSGRLDFDITIAESILNCRRRLSGLVNLALRVVTVEDDAETVAITRAGKSDFRKSISKAAAQGAFSRLLLLMF